MSWYRSSGQDNDVVISSRIRLARNLANYPFPCRMSTEQAEAVIAAVSEAVLPKMEDFTLYRMDALSDIEKRAMLEKHLISSELLQKDLPRAVLIRKDETVSIMINEEDHIRLQVILPGFQPDAAWDLADKMDTLIGETLTFAFHEKFGYLTSCPTNVGTGMRSSAMIHLPALTLAGNLNNLLNSAGKLGMTIRGLYGEGTEALGNLYQISNQRTLGMTEEELIQRHKSIISQLVTQERTVREKLLDANNAKLRDRVCRAYGIMTNAYTLSSQEFLNLQSDVNLGINLGILQEVDPTKLHTLIVTTQPANVISTAGKQAGPVERDILRAEIVRNTLKKE